jgi:tetratricopeptide (TPR) repeat protein
VTLGSIPVNAIWVNKIELLSQITQEMMARIKPGSNAFERFFANIWWAYGALMQNQVDQAYQTGDQWLANSKELDNPYTWAWSEGLLGVAAMAKGDSNSAKTHYLGAIQQAEKIGFVRMLLICSETLGALALKENDIEQAQQFSLRCLRITQECGQTREVLASLRDLASVYMAQGNLEQALQLLAIVLNHPASEQNSLFRPERLRDEAEKLRAQIELQLAPSLYQAAWEAGQRRRLANVVAQLLH